MYQSDETHWDKVTRLIELAKTDESVREIFQHGTAVQRVEILRREGVELEHIAQVVDDLVLITGGPTGPFWWWMSGPTIPPELSQATQPTARKAASRKSPGRRK